MELTELSNQKYFENSQEEVEMLLISILKANSVLSLLANQKNEFFGKGKFSANLETTQSIDAQLTRIMDNMMRFHVYKEIRVEGKIKAKRTYNTAPSKEEIDHIRKEVVEQGEEIINRTTRIVKGAVSKEEQRIRKFAEKVEKIREGTKERDHKKVEEAVKKLTKNEFKSEINVPSIYETAESILEVCGMIQKEKFTPNQKKMAEISAKELRKALKNAKVKKAIFLPNGKRLKGFKEHKPVNPYLGEINAEVVAIELCREVA